jgi:GNAT superfamily N-acetyltransferase
VAELARTWEVEVELIDGSSVRIRPISPADGDLLRAGFEKLSPESRRRRFLAAITRLSDSMVAYLTDVDHHDHEALLAIDPETGEGAGVARYVREPGTDDAEAAVTVADDWQGRGLGTALLELLADRARDEGVRRFKAFVLAGNRPMLEVLEGLGYARPTTPAGDTVELVMELPEDGLGPQLHHALRMAATRPPRLVMRLTPLEPSHPLEIAGDPHPPSAT